MRVTNGVTGKQKVDINIPLSLVDMVLRFVPQNSKVDVQKLPRRNCQWYPRPHRRRDGQRKRRPRRDLLRIGGLQITRSTSACRGTRSIRSAGVPACLFRRTLCPDLVSRLLHLPELAGHKSPPVIVEPELTLHAGLRALDTQPNPLFSVPRKYFPQLAFTAQCRHDADLVVKRVLIRPGLGSLRKQLIGSWL